MRSTCPIPDNFSAGDVMWEFTSADDSNMGVAIPRPTIARLANDKWVAIVANGYNSGGNAMLFVLDLETGAVIREIDTGVGGDNGLSNPTPVDVDGDRIIDYVYAGDLRGNMWKFDVTSSNSADWDVAFAWRRAGAAVYGLQQRSLYGWQPAADHRASRGGHQPASRLLRLLWHGTLLCRGRQWCGYRRQHGLCHPRQQREGRNDTGAARRLDGRLWWSRKSSTRT